MHKQKTGDDAWTGKEPRLRGVVQVGGLGVTLVLADPGIALQYQVRRADR
jgi:hypothetical protein